MTKFKKDLENYVDACQIVTNYLKESLKNANNNGIVPCGTEAISHCIVILEIAVNDLEKAIEQEYITLHINEKPHE